MDTTESTIQPATAGNVTQQYQLSDYSKRPYTITIKSLDYGYHVIVGCKEFAISNTKELVNLVGEYLTAPQQTHKKYYDGELFKTAQQ